MAEDQLRELLKGLPGFSSLTDGMLSAALEGALIPDKAGHYPGTEGYTPTYDVYFAAYSLVGYLRSLPVVTSTSSEGTSVSSTPPDWDALLRYFASRSRVVGSQLDVLRIIPIPETEYVVKEQGFNV